MLPSIGYNYSNLRYSIAGNEQGTDPNVLSELKWTKLRSIEYGLGLQGYILSNRFLYKVQYARSNVFDGEVSDIDYAEDNRQGIFSELYLSSHDGFFNRFNFQIGYALIHNDRFSLSGLLGFDNMHQRVYVLNHKGDDDYSNPLGYFEGLNSYYNTGWRSFGFNVLADYLLPSRFSVNADAGIYTSRYEGYGNWNLIPNFAHPKSYTHKGTGYRLIGDLVLAYKVSNRTSIATGYNFNYASLRDGRDVLYLRSGEEYTTKLNEVRSNGNHIYLKYIYSLIQ